MYEKVKSHIRALKDKEKRKAKLVGKGKYCFIINARKKNNAINAIL